MANPDFPDWQRQIFVLNTTNLAALSDWSNVPNPIANVLDGDLATQATVGATFETVLDMRRLLHIHTIALAISLKQSGSGSTTCTLSQSTDNVVFTTIGTATINNGSAPPVQKFISGSDIDARYIKIKFTNSGGVPDGHIQYITIL